MTGKRWTKLQRWKSAGPTARLGWKKRDSIREKLIFTITICLNAFTKKTREKEFVTTCSVNLTMH